MQRRSFVYTATVALFLPLRALAQQKSLEMPGVQLNGASREQIRQALRKQGVKALREDLAYWFDTYSAQGLLEGADELAMGYLTSGRFAVATYTLPSFMDVQQASRVAEMVSSKYGRPTAVRGNYGIGPATATWSLGSSARVEVFREWPNTTTYLRLSDPAAMEQMRSEMEEDRKAQAAQKAKAQSKSF